MAIFWKSGAALTCDAMCGMCVRFAWADPDGDDRAVSGLQCAQGRAAWLERGRRCSVQENSASCHRRWVKRNRVTVCCFNSNHIHYLVSAILHKLIILINLRFLLPHPVSAFRDLHNIDATDGQRIFVLISTIHFRQMKNSTHNNNKKTYSDSRFIAGWIVGR